MFKENRIHFNSLIFLISLSIFPSVLQAKKNKQLILSGPKGLLADIGAEVLRVAYKKIGIEIKIEDYPTKRSLLLANNGDIDGEIIRIKEINRKYPNLLLVDVSTVQDEIVGFSKNSIMIDGWTDLKKYKLGALSGIKVIANNTKDFNIRFNPDINSVFRMLNLGRIDIAVASRIQGKYVLSKLDSPNIKVLEKPLFEIVLYHFLNKKHEKLVPQIKKILLQMRDNKELNKIKTKLVESL